jgi:ubiquinone/menaquinone biosynthesis C-methylase UbiE
MLKQSSEYLANGFATVDSNKNQIIYINCLNYIDSLPYFNEVKVKTYELLQLEDAHSVLEIGCGTGNDIYRMASLLPNKSKITGIDKSAFMIETAQNNQMYKCTENIEFKIADARVLPFKSSSFDRCRVDRTLQHIENPQQVINEAYRILKSNGIFVAYDNDWSSFSLSLTNNRLSRIVENYWCDAFVNGRIASHLKAYFSTSGFKNITIYPSTLVLDNFEIADKIYDIKKTINNALLEGLLSIKEAEDILTECKEQSSNNSFICALTSYTIIGTKIEN